MKSFRRTVPLIAVCHLPALAGTKGHVSQQEVIEHALHDLAVCEEMGVDGLLLENENDMPYDVEVRASVVSSMTAVLCEVMKHRENVVIGVEYLINDPLASLATAYTCGADFIRTDYFVDRMARAEYGGEMKIIPGELQKIRDDFAKRSHFIGILADIQVKYAQLLEQGKELSKSAQEARFYGAQAAIISGVATGHAPTSEDFLRARSEGDVGALYIGSGLSPENAASLVPALDGAIVGTSLMEHGRLCPKRCQDLLTFFERR